MYVTVRQDVQKVRCAERFPTIRNLHRFLVPLLKPLQSFPDLPYADLWRRNTACSPFAIVGIIVSLEIAIVEILVSHEIAIVWILLSYEFAIVGIIESYEIALCQRDSIFVRPSLSTHA